MRWSMSSSTRASSMTTATSTSSWNMQSWPGRHPGEDHGSQRDRRRPNCISCRRFVPERLGIVDRRIQQGSRETKPQTDHPPQSPLPRGAKGYERGCGTHSLLGEFILSCEGEVPLLFTDNTTNNERLFPGQANDSPYVKDGSTTSCARQQGCGESEKQVPRSPALPGQGRRRSEHRGRLRLSNISANQVSNPLEGFRCSIC